MSNELKDLTTLRLTEDTTVDLDNSMTIEHIQMLIDEQPKDLGGYTLTFQFADGTYNLDTGPIFYDYFSGRCLVYGNSNDFNFGTSKSVVLNIASGNGIMMVRCSPNSFIGGFRVNVNTSSTNTQGIYVLDTITIYVRYNYVSGSNIDNGVGIEIHQCSFGYIIQNYISNIKEGIYAYGSRINSKENSDTGTQPKYGLYANTSATIGKSGTQPSGSTANEHTNAGSVIR